MPDDQDTSNPSVVTNNLDRGFTRPNGEPPPMATPPPMPPPTPPLSLLNKPPKPEAPVASMESPLGQGVKEMPDPPDPFAKIETDGVVSGRSDQTAKVSQTKEEPTPPPSVRPPEVVEAIRASRVRIQVRTTRKRIVVLIIFLIVLATLILGIYFFVKSLKRVPAENNAYKFDSLEIPATPTATSSAVTVLKSEKGFGALAGVDFSLLEITGLDLKNLVVGQEATLSGQIQNQKGKAPVYRASRIATESAIFLSGQNLLPDKIKNFSAVDFYKVVENDEHSLYPLEDPTESLNRALENEKFYGQITPKVNLAQDSLTNLTLTQIDLGYWQAGQFWQPIYTIFGEGKTKKGLKFQIILLAPALKP